MVIDHVALYVHKLEETRDFFARYFQAIAGSEYHNPKTGLRTYFLTFSPGARLEIMTRDPLPDGNPAQTTTGLHHLAFSLGSREAVDTLTTQLAADGYPVLSGPRVTGDGYYESCVQGPDGCRLELTA
ncbi:MAG: VOC family protein [Eubacteriales bacterium]|nr:VOC family protein [Eubacteriales bacterium]